MVFDSIEPIGDTHGDFRNAITAALIANANRDIEKRPEPFTVDDFMPNFWAEPAEAGDRAEDWRANLAIAEVLTIALGGKDLRNGNACDTGN